MNKPSKCYTLRITLLNVVPAVWRSVQLPSTISLSGLNDVLQAVMGWENAHLHQFIKGKESYMPAEILTESDFWGSTKTLDYTDITLDALLGRKGSKIHYEYDFGDGWMHEIQLEEQRSYLKGEESFFLLLDGANACPPEDCGGSFGYRVLQEAMKYPDSEAYRGYMDWLSEPFNPEEFALGEIQLLLQQLRAL